MASVALITGVGMIKFAKPGTQQPYPLMARDAIRAALQDAGIAYDEVQAAYAGFSYGPTTSGQRALYEVGMTGIPVTNVRNACATGSSALALARQSVLSGLADCVLAFGCEEMRPGALANDDFRTSPVDHFFAGFKSLGFEINEAMAAPAMFAAAGLDYLKRYDADPRIFAEVAVKTRRHAANNPLALLTKPITVEEVLQSPIIVEPYLTRLMACPPTCGAAAAIVCSESFARRRSLSSGVEIAGQALLTDTRVSYESGMNLVGRDITQRAAQRAYAEAAVGPEDVDVVELHDCFTPNEVISYEALGLCPEGEATRFIADGDNTYGGKFVVNPSGGLMSKGHPVGATGLAQCYELVSQLRGTAERRQVPDARIALQHNIGMGSAGVVTIYRRRDAA
jgi:sterol carrier protein 2